MDLTTKLAILALVFVAALASGCASGPTITGSALQELSTHAGDQPLPRARNGEQADVTFVNGEHLQFDAGDARVHRDLATGVGRLVLSDDYGPTHDASFRLSTIDHIDLDRGGAGNLVGPLVITGVVLVLAGLLVGGLVAIASSHSSYSYGPSFSGW